MTRGLVSHGLRWRLQSLGMAFGLWTILVLVANGAEAAEGSFGVTVALLVLSVWLALAFADMAWYGIVVGMRQVELGRYGAEDEEAEST